MTEAIKIDGLTEFSKALKDMGAELPKGLRLALNACADVVITPARAGMPSVTGRAKSSIRATSTQDKVRVTEGGKKAPWVPWLDYGGEGKRKGRPAKRPYIKSGRFLYPVYFKKRDSGEFETILTDGLIEVARAAGVEVT